MKQKTTTIKNRAGIHARPAALIVQTASQFESNIYLEKESEKINAKSIMGIITLGASYKTEIIISAEGNDELEAVNAITALFEKKFEEE
jgi:phosphocarrier protein HPr